MSSFKSEHYLKNQKKVLDILKICNLNNFN